MKNSFYSIIASFFILFSMPIAAEEQSWVDTFKNIPSSIIQGIGTLTRKVPLFWVVHNTMTCSDCYQRAKQFLIAAQKGDIETIKNCIEKDVRVNIQDKDGNTALHLAALHGHTEIVQLLLATRLNNSYFTALRGKRAYILTNKNNETAVHCAACHDDPTTLALLLNQNNFANNQKKYPNNNGLTPLLLAVYHGKTNNVKLLIKSVGHTQRDNNNKTILHIAVEKNHKDLIEYLAQYKDLINAIDKKGNPPLIYACNTDVFSILAQNGADVTKCSSDGTWLHTAVKKNDSRMLTTALASKIPIDAKDADGNTAIMLAGQANYISVCNQLFNHGANINLQNNEGASLLSIAVSNNYVELTQEIINKKNVLINLKDRCGKTPLHIAGLNKNETIVNLLLDKGANINERTNAGNTVIAIAAADGNKSMLYLLVKHPHADVNIPDQAQKTPLMKAVMSGNRPSVNILLHKNAHTSSIDRAGQTALHYAAKTGFTDITQDLLDRNIHLLNITDLHANSPLHSSLQHKHSPVAKLLIDYKANLNLFNKEGNTPLHEATLINNENIALYMLEKGALITQNKNGYSPTHYAAQKGFKSLLQKLWIYDNNKSAITNDKNTHLLLALKNNHPECAEIVMDYHTINHQDENGNTAFNIAIMKKNNVAIDNLYRYGANVLLNNYSGDTAAHIAAQYGNVYALSFLNQHGINLWQKNNKLKTPFDDAAYNGELESVKFFIEKYNVSANVIENAINQASSNGKYPVAEFLKKENQTIKTECETILRVQNILNNLRSTNNEKSRELLQKDKYVVVYQPSSYAPQHYTMAQLLSWQQSERKQKITALLYLQSQEVQEKNRIEQKLAHIKEEERRKAEENEKNRLECDTILRIQKTIQDISAANSEKNKELLKCNKDIQVNLYQPTTTQHYTSYQLLSLPSTERKKIIETLSKMQATEQQEKTKLEQKLTEHKNALEKQRADNKKQDAKPSQNAQVKKEEKNEECCICLDEKPDAKAIPCKHCKQGSSRICIPCLTEIAKRSNKCPMCNKDTLETK